MTLGESSIPQLVMNKSDLIYYLSGAADDELFARSSAVKMATVGPKVYLRGLIELSNICVRDCYYCGLRLSNDRVVRYNLSDAQVEVAARYALDNEYASLVIQSGELRSEQFTDKIERLLRLVADVSGGALAVTLSCGEQSEATYRRWFAAGAHRYLLRIESSSPVIFGKIHPATIDFDQRVECIKVLKRVGFQTGSGVMIGLPYQSVGDLADDLLWMQSIDIDMCGMGPYIEHVDTPLGSVSAAFDRSARVALTLRMVALLRLLMPSINIASTTALSTLDPVARLRAIEVGANVIMPNITPSADRSHYNLYDNKATDLDLERFNIAYGEQGTSLHYQK